MANSYQSGSIPELHDKPVAADIGSLDDKQLKPPVCVVLCAMANAFDYTWLWV